MNKHVFQYKGSLNIKKSRVFNENDINPKDDKVNWLFIEINKHKYSFIYEIINSENSFFEKDFKILLKFLMIEEIENLIDFNLDYPVYRGDELIGMVVIHNKLM